MKKIVKIIAMVLSTMFLFVACAKPIIEVSGEEVITDKNMASGVNVLGKTSIYDLDKTFLKMDYLDSSSSSVPIWRLAQWGTRFPFADQKTIDERKSAGGIDDGWAVNATATQQAQDGDNFIIKDNTKEFIVNPKTGQYSLNCYTSDEYPTPKPMGKEWLHFITIQDVVDVSRIDEMKNIYVDLDFEITKCDNLMGSSFDPNLHTALFQWVFIIKNENIDSLDYGQYFWLNIPYFDPRHEFSDEAAFLDFGKEDKSTSFIFSADTRQIMENKTMPVGERRRICFDLIPYIQRGLSVVQELPKNIESDAPHLLNTTLSDLRVQQFYIGWEVPGTYDACATIYSNSLKYRRA